MDIALNSGNEKAIEVLRSYETGIENKVIQKVITGKPSSSLDEAESTKMKSPIKQK